MRIWIVNPFDPLPGDPEQEGRYASLAKLLVARGHRVLWWTSTFSHRFKRPVDQVAIRTACAACGVDIEFLAAPPYQRNVSLRRVRNHHVLAKRFAAAALPRAPRPDVILASSPPPGLARRAVDVACALGVRSVIDVQDAWPDVFASLVPRWLRPLVRPALRGLRGNVRRAARGCDAVVGVADAYVDNFLRGTRQAKLTATIPLGVDLAAFDTAAALGKNPRFTKPAGEVWLAYTGSLSRSYDFGTILRAAAKLGPRLDVPIRFFLTGRGDQAAAAQRFLRAHPAPHVTLTGFLEFETWAYLLSQCDVGFNASFPHALIFLPNKVFYYLAAGVAVLNTIPGECSRIVRDGQCGLDYEAGNVGSCAAAIEHVVRDAAARTALRQASRRLAETTYDRHVLFPRFVDLLEELPSRAPGAPFNR
jgi:glycosyltransferase involved in cell wall biosynthesis